MMPGFYAFLEITLQQFLANKKYYSVPLLGKANSEFKNFCNSLRFCLPASLPSIRPIGAR